MRCVGARLCYAATRENTTDECSLGFLLCGAARGDAVMQECSRLCYALLMGLALELYR